MLLSKEYAEERRKLIDMEKASLQVDAGSIRTGDTIYLTVADKDGNMVSLIQSNFRGMGSAVLNLILNLFFSYFCFLFLFFIFYFYFYFIFIFQF